MAQIGFITDLKRILFEYNVVVISIKDPGSRTVHPNITKKFLK